MQSHDQTITDLTLNSSPIEFTTATLRRTADTLPTGLLGSSDWQVEVINGQLPSEVEDVRVELNVDGVSYTGAGRIVEDGARHDDRTLIVANGPLISYAKPH